MRHQAVGLMCVILACSLTLSIGVSHAESFTLEPAIPVGVPAEIVYPALDSGPVSNPHDQRESVYQVVTGETDATWVRVYFGPQTLIKPGGQIRITSLLDGATQLLDPVALEQWHFTTAYFNGSSVQLEILAASGSSGNRLVVSALVIGVQGGVEESFCGEDDRTLSNDPRAGRLFSDGCTAWLINECLVTAGHCITANNSVVLFNVPLSDESGNLMHPLPSDQYSFDFDSLQYVNNGISDDWAYFGVFPNSETSLTALEAQGSKFDLATNVPEVLGQPIRITGYGTDSTPPEHNQAQQTHVGPFREFTGTVVRYEVDTIGGNSGSPIIDETTGAAIGVHTNAGCDSNPPPYNQGTALNNAGLQAALRNPLGVCVALAACDSDGECDAGEDCYTCPADCAYNAPNGEARCGNDVCEIANGENCLNCREDCKGKINGNPANLYCCGDSVGCEDERCFSGGNSCTELSLAGPGFCCGDGACEVGEQETNCPVDCSSSCFEASSCDDSNECTTEDCVSEQCQITPVADKSSCASGDGICCGGKCAEPVCSADLDCDDADDCTIDVCVNPEDECATCENLFPNCGEVDGCCGPGCDSSNDTDCACVPTHSKEKGPRCSDEVDNDCDGSIDIDDSDCG